LPNYQVYILDQHQQPVPVGFPGELYIGGVGLARGYLNRPELTAERFIEWSTTDLDAPAATFTSSHTTIRLYKTGDLARYLRDGNIEFLGRIDHQVKLRGFRIELGEIESVLRRHPAVQDAVVLVREDTPGDPRLVAYITGKAMVIDTVELHDYLQHQLASYMIPSAFVRLQALPLTVNGKVDRRALPMPTADNPAPPATALPRTSEEATLAQIWALVLGRSSVGIYDDFFALGGHSLLAARALALVNERLDRSVSLQVLFECPTVAAFAQALGREAVAATEKAPADLAADVVLGQAINLQVPVSPLTASATAILLTGATGYLGAFLLHELLIQTETTIHCLVRAADDTEAHQRIEEALSRYGIWHESWRSRIVPVVGDLASAQLGLSREAFRRLAVTIDVVYHVGAQVHYLHPYGTLKQANVQGTVEILRLACQERSKPIHYISTLAVVASSRERVYEDDDLPACTSPLGYVQSKWVAEGIIHLARARGVPVSVYRPGRIGCHSQRRIANSDDFFMRLLTACIELGLAPDVPMLENLIPVDYTARAIVHLSQQPALVNTTFHLINPKPTRWSWVVETARHLGYPLRLVPYGEWRSALSTAVSSERGDALHGLLLLTPEDPSAANWIDSWTKQAFDIQNTITGLVGSGLHCPDFDAPMLERMLAAAVRHGLLDAPAQSDHTFEEADTLVP
jgi:thioester reductase-like protein